MKSEAEIRAQFLSQLEAEHYPQAYRDHSDAWIECSCGVGDFGDTAEEWFAHIRSLAAQPANNQVRKFDASLYDPATGEFRNGGMAAQPPATVDAEPKGLREALEFYADPDTYFAVGIFPDPPCGNFMDDFSDTELGRKPGKRARAVLAALLSDEGARK
jgi:hypothetical protein